MYTRCCIGSTYVVSCIDTPRMGDSNCPLAQPQVYTVYKKHHFTEVTLRKAACSTNLQYTILMYVHECMSCIGQSNVYGVYHESISVSGRQQKCTIITHTLNNLVLLKRCIHTSCDTCCILTLTSVPEVGYTVLIPQSDELLPLQKGQCL